MTYRAGPYSPRHAAKGRVWDEVAFYSALGLLILASVALGALVTAL